MRTPVYYALTLIFLNVLCPFNADAQKTDTIYHINGNILTGEFKKMNYGVVTWKMDGMGTIQLETPKIGNIRSDKQFEIKLKNGLIYYGSFDTTNVELKVKIIDNSGPMLINIRDIVEVYPLKKSFWLRTNGTFSLGFNYSLGSEVATLVFGGNLNYRRKKSGFTLNWSTNNTFQADTLTSNNMNVNIGLERTLKGYWSYGSLVGVSQNSQLGFRYRLNLNELIIRDIVYNWWNRFNTAAGLSVQRETPYDDGDVTLDLAGIVMTTWKVYKYTEPKIWVEADLALLPYITGDWRYRANFNLNPKVGIIGNDLQIGLNFYYYYDSKPSTTASTTYDWGLNLELSYNLH